jgi:hypothetical protein
MYIEQVVAAINAISVLVGFVCWTALIVAPLQMAGVI